MIRTIVIQGLLAKTRGRNARDYCDDVTLTYKVTDDVTAEDIRYYLNKRGVRSVPVYKGERTNGVVAIDDSKPKGQYDKPLNRIALTKQLDKDLKGLEWKTPASEQKTEK